MLHGATGSARAGSYETITVSSGQHERIEIGTGETLENTLIDATASGAAVTITAIGDDWTIRNIGVKGKMPDLDDPNSWLLQANGNGTIENCYFGDGTVDESRWSGMTVWGSHSGHITVRNCYIAEWDDNAIYSSDPARDDVGSRGTVGVEGCYFRDNNVSHFRHSSDGGYIENSVIHNTNNVPTTQGNVVHSRGVFSNAGRDSWSIEVRNCDIDLSSSNTNGNATAFAASYDAENGINGTPTGIQVSDSEVVGDVLGDGNVTYDTVGSNPDTSVPSGVPTSAEAAAAGESTDGSSGTSDTSDSSDSDTEDRLLAFITSPDATNATYSFEANGAVEKASATYDTPSGNPIGANGNETIDVSDGTTTVEGLTGNGYGDAFRVNGPVTSITIDDPTVMWVELDGEEMTTDEVIEATAEPSSGDTGSLENRILIDGVGTTGDSQYEFDVTGDVERSTYKGASIDDDIVIEDGHVSGGVTGWRDAFAYSGELENITVEGNARIKVNGEQIDTDNFGDALPRAITIVGNGSNANYRISVDGIVESADSNDLTDSVTVDSGVVEGSITRDIHRFRFSGSVTDLEFTEGTAHVYADRDRIVPDDFSG
jgi:hypothetical protein